MSFRVISTQSNFKQSLKILIYKRYGHVYEVLTNWSQIVHSLKHIK